MLKLRPRAMSGLAPSIVTTVAGPGWHTQRQRVALGSHIRRRTLLHTSWWCVRLYEYDYAMAWRNRYNRTRTYKHIHARTQTRWLRSGFQGLSVLCFSKRGNEPSARPFQWYRRVVWCVSNGKNHRCHSHNNHCARAHNVIGEAHSECEWEGGAVGVWRANDGTGIWKEGGMVVEMGRRRWCWYALCKCVCVFLCGCVWKIIKQKCMEKLKEKFLWHTIYDEEELNQNTSWIITGRCFGEMKKSGITSITYKSEFGSVDMIYNIYIYIHIHNTTARSPHPRVEISSCWLQTEWVQMVLTIQPQIYTMK